MLGFFSYPSSGVSASIREVKTIFTADSEDLERFRCLGNKRVTTVMNCGGFLEIDTKAHCKHKGIPRLIEVYVDQVGHDSNVGVGIPI